MSGPSGPYRNALPGGVSLDDWWNTPVQNRYNILPLAEQPDGSTVPALPGLIAEPFESLKRVMANAGRRETTYDDSGTAINGLGALAPGDGLNAVGLAPMGTMALGTAARAVPRGEIGAVPVRAAGDNSGFVVKHVSPHDFTSFDPDKIGSGIGANTEGRGFYTTTSDKLINDYASEFITPYKYEVSVNENKSKFLDWDSLTPYMQHLLSTPEGVEYARQSRVPGIVAKNTGAGFEGTENYTLFPHAKAEIVHKWGPDGTQIFSNPESSSSVPLALSMAENNSLPMDLASRMARAKEMGFDTDNPLYKGYYPYRSGGPITNVRGEVVREEPYVLKDELSGFFSGNPEVANRFSGIYADENGNYRQLFDDNAVAKVFSRASNPLVIDAEGNYAASVQFDNIAKRDGTTDKYNQWKNAKADGYDSVLIKNTRDEGHIVQVFDPRNIRSVNAAFDPAMSDSANLLAANAKSGAAAPLALSMANAAERPGFTAYHGSPHDFDKFDLSKIGTGEGAQAYGHGLYFAENEGVARGYRDKLGGLRSGFTINGKDYDPIGGRSEAARLAAAENIDPAVAREVLAYHDRTPDQMISDVKRFPGGERDANILAAAEWKRENDLKAGGRMYQVRINADPEQFLDWDKPLSQQNEAVRKAVEGLPQTNIYTRKDGVSEVAPIMDREGEAFYGALAEALGRPWDPARPRVNEWLNHEAASKALLDAGVPGVRYLDQGSRTGGAGTYNYSVFDDSLIDILRKYANPETASSVPLALSMAENASERPWFTAYHGSPHDFDKFDLSKIGTGEGAQAYGHGLYFAENEGVAKWYRERLSNGVVDYSTMTAYGKPLTALHARRNIQNRINNLSLENDRAQRLITRKSKPNERALVTAKIEDNKRLIKLLGEEIDKIKDIPDEHDLRNGRMYQVRINADPESFLDWDKPLSQQNEAVRNALQRRFAGDPARQRDMAYEDGGSLMSNILRNEHGPQTTQALREAGIPGIRYLDQMSRGAGEGSRNYVVFDDSLIDIMKKYANAPTGSVAPLALSQDGEDGVDINEILRRYGMIQ